MAVFVDALAQARFANKVLVAIVAGLGLLAFYGVHGLREAPKDLTLHLPPNLTTGATIKIGQGEVPPASVYTFGFYIWQQVNRWAKNGSEDYGNQIMALQAFLTPQCQEQLKADMNKRSVAGELEQRTRAVMEIPGVGYSDKRVQPMGAGRWKVFVDIQLLETSRGLPVKDAYVRYPLEIVLYDIDRERNPWQLAVDCFGTDKPERLDPKAVELAQKTPGSMVKNTPEYASRYSPAAVELGGAAPPAAPTASGATAAANH